ncbi:MAG: hypothetical protein LBB54_04615 [Cellulomonadaceae bacterium]|jgi:hypothetical protein|nr:hypothetical protein [Cellulomonadaceae bacterium]
MLNFTHGLPVTRRRKQLTGYGAANRPVYETIDTVLDARCGLDPGGSRESAQPGVREVVTQPVAYFTADVHITSDDQLIIGGVCYDVTGDPAHWVSPWTGQHIGTVIHLAATRTGG